MRTWQDMASAVAYLHRQGYMYNDIKPQNIMWSYNRGAVLVDFGLTMVASDNSGGGTPYYVPPEWTGRGVRDITSDIWALGVTMLYAFGYIRLPDTYSVREWHGLPKLYWNISNVRKGLSLDEEDPIKRASLPTEIQKDIDAAEMWQDLIATIAGRLDERQPFLALLKKSLNDRAELRPSAEELQMILAPVGALDLDSAASGHPALEHDARSSQAVQMNHSQLALRNPTKRPAVSDPNIDSAGTDPLPSQFYKDYKPKRLPDRRSARDTQRRSGRH